MTWIRKRFLLLIILLCIYGVYFYVHKPSQSVAPIKGATTNLALFTQPESGKDPIVSAINSSQKEVDIEVYLLSDKDVIAALESACSRGVVVKVMMEEHPFGGGSNNQKTKKELDSSCVSTQWTNPSFSLTHAKIVIIDARIVLILNQNLTNAAFSQNREYDIEDTSPQDVSQLQSLFTDDWSRSGFTQNDTDLLISPLTARDGITSLLSTPAKHIDIEDEVVDDPQILQQLVQDAQKEQIRIILPTLSQIASNKKAINLLSQNGVQVRTLSSPYIHAKLILLDSAKAYVGSINLTSQSMDENREVGIILSQQDILNTLSQDFESDWGNAAPIQ